MFGRTTFVVLFLLVQMGVLLAGFNWLREYMIYVYGGSSLLSAVVPVSYTHLPQRNNKYRIFRRKVRGNSSTAV